ncbi:hypothetical protein NLJ89_g11662 [Agrocybe chaxingu]|uniref:Uncharacterized protein n=1 Tax=Agrocybe chaxingu TaxID=84603 RepID=A0A9W8JNY1_9AGAR|nr:hypothetical protein NLJ89_g11662 [Agrocybe chaxingu]
MNMRPITPNGAANPLPSSSVRDTPRHKNLAATPPCGPVLGFRQYRRQMARDTKGQWVGPISHEAFFAEHMSVDEPVPASLVVANYFDNIPAGKGKTEKHMYDPLIELVTNAKLLDPTCVLVNTSNHADFDSYVEAQWKPDITCYLKEDFCKENPRDEDYRPTKTKDSIKERNPDNSTFFDRSQLCIEMKPDDVSPFNDPPTELGGEALRKFQSALH